MQIWVSNLYYFPSLWKASFNIFHKADLPAINFLHFISPSLLNDNFTGNRILDWCFVFSFQQFKYFTHSLLVCVALKRNPMNSHPSSSRGKVFPLPHDFFQDFLSLPFWFEQTFWYLSYAAFSKFPGPVVWCLSLILENFQPLSLYIFFFSSISLPSPGFPLQLGCTFCNCPTDLRYFVPSFSLTCFLGISSSSFIFFSAMSSLLMNPSKAFFISVTLLSISSIFFYSSLEFPYLCLLYSSVLSYSSFSIRSRSILIIVILNSWSCQIITKSLPYLSLVLMFGLSLQLCFLLVSKS